MDKINLQSRTSDGRIIATVCDENQNIKTLILSKQDIASLREQIRLYYNSNNTAKLDILSGRKVNLKENISQKHSDTSNIEISKKLFKKYQLVFKQYKKLKWQIESQNRLISNLKAEINALKKESH